MPKARASKTSRIAVSAVGKPITSIRKVDQGQDGDKFDVVTVDGDHLFCRVRDEISSQELPFQEPEILRAVNSPHIVKPTKVDKIRGHYVIVRPFIDGETLTERLRRGTLDLTEIKKLATTLFETIRSLDEAGAVHFDIKPDNIIVDANGEYKIIDFGAAKFLKAMKTEKIFPARKFIAPEVLQYLFDPAELHLQRLSTLSDMYGAGGVLYACATGHNISEFFRSSSDVLQKSPPPVRHFIPEFDEDVSDLVGRLLEKNPSRRPRAEEALLILSGQAARHIALPSFFLKVSTLGRGSDHSKMLDAIVSARDEVGVYWRSNGTPRFPKKSTPMNIIWECSPRGSETELRDDLLRQYERGCIILTIPGKELENAANPAVLKENLAAIDIGLEWRRQNAAHLPVFAVISIEDALLTSAQGASIKDAYAAKAIDGIVLRVCVPGRTNLDARQLRAIKDFIEPWARSHRPVLYDGDLSVLPLGLFGVSGLIAATYPRSKVLTARQTRPAFARRPDGIYVPRLLAIISSDSVISLRASAYGKTLTNCHCPFCASGLMGGGQWSRADRRKHFIYVFPKDFRDIKNGSVHDLQQRIQQAQTDAARFPNIRMDLSNLRTWSDFLR